MTARSKPILHNGYEIAAGLTIQSRVERVFFTEVYILSDSRYFYLFTELKPEKVINSQKRSSLLHIKLANADYYGLVLETHQSAQVADVLNSLTTLKGLDCVAGMKELKHILLNDVIKPLREPDLFEKFKLGIPNGILLYGPPGCGKTFIVRKLAEELRYNFVETKHSDVGSPYIHGSVGKIAALFEKAEANAPSILFIDEIEGLVPRREGLESTSQYKQEEVNEFLMQLNDAAKKKILVVGATNRPQLIDTAILRSGRMDRRIFVPPPDSDAREELFRIYLMGRPHSSAIDYKRLAKLTDNFVCSDIELVVTEAARKAVHEKKEEISEITLNAILDGFNPSVSRDEISSYKKFSELER